MNKRNVVVCAIVVIGVILVWKQIGLAGLGGRAPKLAVTFDPTGFWRVVRVISHDDAPVTVTRVIINGREGDENCDIRPEAAEQKSKPKDPLSQLLPRNPLPATLHLSEGFEVTSSAYCNTPVKVDIVTQNGGVYTYEFE